MYKFMRSAEKLDENRIKEWYKKKYNIEFSERLVEPGDKGLHIILARHIRKKGFDIEAFNEIFDKEGNSSKGKEILKYVSKRLDIILNNPDNYYTDLVCAIFQGFLYNEEKQDLFLYKKKIEGLSEKQIQELEKIRATMESAWIRNSNKTKNSDKAKVNKNSARSNYPRIVIGDSGKIEKLPGGCMAYHREMLSISNIGIFDLETNIKSYKRYSYTRAYDIYSKLKETPIENLLLLEQTLGIGYTNIVYAYLKKIKVPQELEKHFGLINAGAQIKPFFIRKKIIEPIWKFIDTADIETLKLLEEITLYVKDIVENVFVGVLEAWWYAYCCHYEENSLVDHMSFFLEQRWKEYYEEEEIHKDYLELLGVCDWRNIRSDEDCFYNVSEFRETDIQYKGRLNSVLDFTHGLQVINVDTISGEEVSFIVEGASNKIGEYILDDVQNKLSKVNIPECDEDKYSLYYRLREQSFNIKRKEDMRCWKEADVVIRDNAESIECSHAYALIHKNIIITLLSQI